MGPDWILIEGDSALVIECSTTRLVMRSKTTADFDAYRRDVISKIAGMVNLFPEKVRHLQRDRSTWPELTNVKHFYPVIVTYDAWWISQTIADMIRAEPPPKFDPNLPYHIISVDELEHLAAFGRAGLQVAPIFADRIRQGTVGDHLGNALNAVARTQRLDQERNVILGRARDEIFDSVAGGER